MSKALMNFDVTHRFPLVKNYYCDYTWHHKTNTSCHRAKRFMKPIQRRKIPQSDRSWDTDKKPSRNRNQSNAIENLTTLLRPTKKFPSYPHKETLSLLEPATRRRAMKFLTLICTPPDAQGNKWHHPSSHAISLVCHQERKTFTRNALMVATTTLPCLAYFPGDFLIDGCLMCDIYSCLQFRHVSGALPARASSSWHLPTTFANFWKPLAGHWSVQSQPGEMLGRFAETTRERLQHWEDPVG